MKNNLDKLNDAVGMLDEKTVKEAMDVGVRHRRTVHRRAVALIAACLALILVAGGLVAVPLLSAPEPVVETSPDTSPTVSDTESTQVKTIDGIAYIEYPVVKLAVYTEIVKPSEDEPGQDEGTIEGSIPLSKTVLTFDIADDEKVSLSAYQVDQSLDGLYLKALFDAYLQDPDGAITINWSDIIRNLAYTRQEETDTETEIEAETDSQTESGGLGDEDYGTYLDPIEYTPMPEKMVLDYIVQNKEGQTVGVGSILVVHRRLIQDKNNLLYENSLIIRGADLGSVRFLDPSGVTDEAVSELLCEMHDRIDETYASLDFSPQGEEELYNAGLADMFNTCFPVWPEHRICLMPILPISCPQTYRIFSIGFGGDADMSEAFDSMKHPMASMSFIGYYIVYRQFIIFNDGTWAEIAEVSQGHIYTLTDGRVLETRLLDYDGEQKWGAVFISEETGTETNQAD